MTRRAAGKLRKNVLDTLPAIALLLAALLLRRRIAKLLTVLLLACMLSLLLWPAVSALERRLRWKRRTCILTVYLLSVLLLGAMLGLLVPVIAVNTGEILRDFESVRDRVASSLGPWYARLRADRLAEQAYRKLTSLADGLGALFLELAGVLAALAVAFILSYYMLRDREKLGTWILSLFPFSWRPAMRAFGRRAARVWSRFVSGQLLIAAIIGMTETAGLVLLGVPFPYLFGLIGGLSNLIPYVGPFLGAVPAVLAAVSGGLSLLRILGVAAVFVGVQQFDNWYLTPHIMKDNLHLHPAVTMLAVLAGAELFGFVGAALAVPVAGILLALRD